MSDDDEQPPRKVYWSGRQWCVTDFGLETINPDRYYVEPSQLRRLTEGAGIPMAEGLRHIGEKTWVDIEDLAAAFAVAVQVHKLELPHDAFINALSVIRMGRAEDKAFRESRTAAGETSDIISGIDIGKHEGNVAAALAERVAKFGEFRFIPDPAVRPDWEEPADEDEGEG